LRQGLVFDRQRDDEVLVSLHSALRDRIIHGIDGT